MSKQITSTTDSAEAVTAALGGLAKEESKVEETSVPEQKAQGESAEESETTEKEESSETESEELEASDDSGEEAEEESEPKPKKSNGYKKKIAKMARTLSEKDQRIAYLEGLQARSNQETDSQSKAKSASEDSSESSKPAKENFESLEEYYEALTDWKIEQREAKKVKADKETHAKSEYQKQLETFASKTNDFKKQAPDFDEVIADVDDVIVSAGLNEALLSSENGPQLIYELAKNRAELERINALSTVAAARELGKLEARIAKATSQSLPKKQTKAPAPVNPVGSAGSGKVMKSPDQMNYQEFKKAREAGLL